jgi:hypothetical protein
MTQKNFKIKGYRSIDDVSLSDMGWKDRSACADKELSIFFASPKSDVTTVAISICKTCPVRQECFYEAITYGYDGVWGGSTYDQRRALIINFLDSDLTNLTKKLSNELVSIVDFIGKTKNTALHSLQNIKTQTME